MIKFVGSLTVRRRPGRWTPRVSGRVRGSARCKPDSPPKRRVATTRNLRRQGPLALGGPGPSPSPGPARRRAGHLQPESGCGPAARCPEPTGTVRVHWNPAAGCRGGRASLGQAPSPTRSSLGASPGPDSDWAPGARVCGRSRLG